MGERSGRRTVPPGRRRRLVTTLVSLALTALTAFAAASLYVISLPSVGDAQTRVERILALHHDPYGAMPPPRRLGDAVVAVEDEHFYANVFINTLDGIGRAALAALLGSRDPGGSTIAQQLAKQLYGHGTSLPATLREIALGVKLSLRYTKPQILDMYLNAVYYGHGYWGEIAAARGYFGVNPNALDWAQAAMLAGLLQAPSAYDPLVHYALAKRRQRHVLNQLIVNHYLTAVQADAVFHEPLHLR
jgi:membrane peptidoglycan carboxypeptidase